MQIALLEPFYSGSHAMWVEGYTSCSQHQLIHFTLPGRHWKWRMHGGAVSLAKAYIEAHVQPEMILSTDMMDLSVFLSLTRRITPYIPAVLYMHENQLTYPWSPSDPDPPLKRDRHYAFINLTSALSADYVFFNSAYHLGVFLEALPSYLSAFPDYPLSKTTDQIAAKSEVLPIGLDLNFFQTNKPHIAKEGPLIILWNHRWEYDKDPETFFKILFQLSEENVDFRVVVLGESYKRVPPIFKDAQIKLQEKIMYMGFARTRADYASWLWKADLIPVTSFQDFFGISLVEALYCNTYPLLPNRLAYPEYIPTHVQAFHIYKDSHELLENLRFACQNPEKIRAVQTQSWVRKYDWQFMGPVYDNTFQRISQNLSSI